MDMIDAVVHVFALGDSYELHHLSVFVLEFNVECFHRYIVPRLGSLRYVLLHLLTNSFRVKCALPRRLPQILPRG